MTLILQNIGKLFEPKYKNLDAKFWVQKVILKKYLKKINNRVNCPEIRFKYYIFFDRKTLSACSSIG